MKASEIKQQLRELADALMEDGGVSAMSLVDAFKASTDPDQLLYLGAEALDELVMRWSKDIVKERSTRSNAQLTLPGIGEVDATVTTVDGEGGYVVRFLKHASRGDLVVDRRLHFENMNAATAAFDRADRRNELLLPLMEKYGCETVADVLPYLAELDDRP